MVASMPELTCSVRLIDQVPGRFEIPRDQDLRFPRKRYLRRTAITCCRHRLAPFPEFSITYASANPCAWMPAHLLADQNVSGSRQGRDPAQACRQSHPDYEHRELPLARRLMRWLDEGP
jgi:hypothetical protein